MAPWPYVQPRLPSRCSPADGLEQSGEADDLGSWQMTLGPGYPLVNSQGLMVV